MSWISDFRRDLARYSNGKRRAGVKEVLLETGLWATLQYRVEAAVYRSGLPRPVKAPLRLILTITHKIVEVLTGISLPCTARIGPGLHLPHCGFRILHSATVIGSDCCISQGATIGISGRGEHRGVPVIGNRVYLAANAVVVGKITIGDDVAVGANSVVNRDVPEHCTVAGVPAQIVNRRGSSDYLGLSSESNPTPIDVPARTQRDLKGMRLLVAARVVHYQHNGQFYSYTPYARELDVWADLFASVTIAGTLRYGPPPGDCSPFTRSNIKVVSIAEAGGHGIGAKLKQLFVLPQIICQLAGHMLRADAIHARCPCDLGMLALLLGPLFSRRLIAKYATQWLPFPGEPLSWRAQRSMLRSGWWRGPVTVYGHWPNQPGKVIPFFTSMLTRKHLTHAQSVTTKRSNEVFRILFVGRLSTAKNVDVLIRAVSALDMRGNKLECVIVGEGPQREQLEQLASELGLRQSIHFTGGLDFESVLAWYEKANALVLASDVEGWPKAIAEAMAFGVVCIGTERGMMPQMLGDGRGLLVPLRSAPALTRALQWVIDHPNETHTMSTRAAKWAQAYSLEGLREALDQLMTSHWNMNARTTVVSGTKPQAALIK